MLVCFMKCVGVCLNTILTWPTSTLPASTWAPSFNICLKLTSSWSRLTSCSSKSEKWNRLKEKKKVILWVSQCPLSWDASSYKSPLNVRQISVTFATVVEDIVNSIIWCSDVYLCRAREKTKTSVCPSNTQHDTNKLFLEQSVWDGKLNCEYTLFLIEVCSEA